MTVVLDEGPIPSHPELDEGHYLDGAHRSQGKVSQKRANFYISLDPSLLLPI